MSETMDALQGELVGAIRALKEAEERAHKDSWRCTNCGQVETLNVRLAEGNVLRLARALGDAIGEAEA